MIDALVRRQRTEIDRVESTAEVAQPRHFSGDRAGGKSSSVPSCVWMPLPAAIDGCRRAN